ncbi:MAG: CBS domain-containing protein [Pseudomonadota bacterium]
MPQPYTPLAHTRLSPRATYARPTPPSNRVTMDSPAVEVMTDLQRVTAVTVTAGASIELANQRMIAGGVRLLLVLNEDKNLTGLVTASDILGEKPLQYLRKRGGTFSDVLVYDIMIPQDQLDVLPLSDVLNARVGDIVATLTRFGRQHALVVEQTGGDGMQKVRGIFSATQISRQLGTEVMTAEIATTFAALEAVLGS